jgi:hypothetical protein
VEQSAAASGLKTEKGVLYQALSPDLFLDSVCNVKVNGGCVCSGPHHATYSEQ